MIVPPAFAVTPLRVAVSLIGLPIVTDAAFFVSVVRAAQLEMVTAWGGTKSLSAALNSAEERLLRYADPNCPHVFWPNNALNEIDASPKVRALRAPTRELLAVIGLELMVPRACTGF